MSIYLVRWPDLSASLVEAEGEEHLLDILDQVGNPDDCEWSLYDGPLFIDFRLPVEWSIEDSQPGPPHQIVIGDVGEIETGNIIEAMQVCLADADDGYGTGAEILRVAFPKLHAAIEEFDAASGSLDSEGALPPARLRAALHAELERSLHRFWRRAQLAKKTDAISQLAREMDMPVRLLRRYAEAAREQQRDEPNEQRPPENTSSTRSKLFSVSNHHTEACGQPRAIDGDEPGKYFGYFANQYGEQSVFVYDYQTREASIWMGDGTWDQAHRVVDGRVDGLTLTESEAAWVHACWLAASAAQ